eukprot:gene7748-10525_t
MKSSSYLLRGAKGRGFYQAFVKSGVEAFTKNPTVKPFDWSKTLDIYRLDKLKELGVNIDPNTNRVIRSKAYFDIAIGKDDIGRVVFELADDVVPISVRHFLNLVSNLDKSHTYEGSKFHSIMKGMAIMGGELSPSVRIKCIPDENHIIPHTEKGLLSFASVGVNTSSTQFYISLNANPHMNGRCVVIGRVIQGMDVIDKAEQVFTFRHAPATDIIIKSVGIC